jgi:hypothetical protein
MHERIPERYDVNVYIQMRVYVHACMNIPKFLLMYTHDVVGGGGGEQEGTLDG